MPIFYVDSKNYLPRVIMGLRIIQILSPERAREIMFCIIRNPIISRGRSFLLSTWKIGINVFISSLPFQRYNKWRSKLMLPAVSHVTDWMCGVGGGGERVRAVGKPTRVNLWNYWLKHGLRYYIPEIFSAQCNLRFKSLKSRYIKEMK